MICERHMKKKHRKHRRHMDKDIYIYKYEESSVFLVLWDILKQFLSTTGVVDCVCFEEERATRLLKDTRKDKIAVFFFLVLSSYTHSKHYILRQRQNTDKGERKLVKQQQKKETKGFIRKYAQHGKHMIQRVINEKRNEQKLSGVYQCCSVSQTTSVKMAYSKIYIYINRMESSK